MNRYRMDKPTLMWFDDNGEYVTAVDALAVIDSLKLQLSSANDTIVRLTRVLPPMSPVAEFDLRNSLKFAREARDNYKNQLKELRAKLEDKEGEDTMRSLFEKLVAERALTSSLRARLQKARNALEDGNVH